MFYLNFKFHCIILSVLDYGIKKEEKENKTQQKEAHRGKFSPVRSYLLGAENLFFMYVWAWKAHLRCLALPFPLKVKVIVIQMVPLILIWKDG